MNKEAKETLDLDKEEVIQNEQVNTETDAENTPQGEAEMSDADKMSAMAAEIENLRISICVKLPNLTTTANAH